MKKLTRRLFLKASLAIAGLFSSAKGLFAAADPRKSEAWKRYQAMTPEEVKQHRREFNKIRPVVMKQMPEFRKPGKWQIHILGSCSGTQPMPHNNHTSWVLERPDGELYWFDAGEYCSWTAHNMGLEVYRAHNLFISHPHGDHVWGLAGLFGTICKMHWVYRSKERVQINIYGSASTEHAVRAAEKMLTNGHPWKAVNYKTIEMGEIFNDGKIIVDTVPNMHMPLRDGKPQSHSFRIKIPEIKKTVVFSGDVRHVDEMMTFFNEDGGVDLLMMETGHHRADEVCKHLRAAYPNKIKEIMFVHHGMNLLWDTEFEHARAELEWGKPVIISKDRQTYPLS